MTDNRLATDVENWLRKHACIGASCGNCRKPFAAARKVKGVVGIPNGAGYSIYVLCRPCARRFKRQGPSGIPNAVRDAELATLLRFMPTKGRA